MNTFVLYLSFASINTFKGPWDQERFDDLLAKWIVATDQPFSMVDEPEFRMMLSCAHHPPPELKIPHRNAVRRRIMRMGEDSIEATKEMFTVCQSQLHITGSLTKDDRPMLKAR